MDRFEKVVKDFSDALKRFREALTKVEEYRGSEDYPFFRDSAIQRFEFTFEIMWKAIKIFLESEGITCRSPKACIRELFTAGYISEEDVRELFRMLSDRNLTVHTYREDIAEEIMSRLKDYIKTLCKLEAIFKERG